MRVLRGLRKKESPELLRHRLLEIPTDLNAFYQRIIDEIPDGDRKEVGRILGIAISSVEPLSLEVFQDAVNHSMSHSERHLDGPDVFTSHDMLGSVEDYQERLEAVSGGLVEIRDLRHQPQDTRRRVVVLSHQTVYTFLSHCKGLENHDENQFLTVTGNVSLLTACVQSILGIVSSRQLSMVASKSKVQVLNEQSTLGALKTAGEDPPRVYNFDKRSLNVCSFLKYAVAHWIQHAKKVDEGLDASSSQLLSRLSRLNFTL